MKTIIYADKDIMEGERIAYVNNSGEIVSDNASFLPYGKRKLFYKVNNMYGIWPKIMYFLKRRS